MRAISVQSITKYLGGRALFKDLSFTLYERDKCGLVGRNGCGKSSILRILGDDLVPDEGKIVISPALRLGILPQLTDYSWCDESVEHVVLQTQSDLNLVRESLKICGFEDMAAHAKTLSGGWQKRLAFAVMLAQKPDFLILDEPTNHLDFDGLQWLGRTLQKFEGGYLMVSHDRAILRDQCTQFLEISPFGILAVKGSFDEYRAVRAESLRQLERERDKVANIARRELEWLRSGAKARSTKAKARINTAEAAQDRASELNRLTKAEESTNLSFTTSSHLGKELLIAKNITFPPVWHSLPELRLAPGVRLCVVGPNGCGKSTLLKLLLAELEPATGFIRVGQSVQFGVFDQHKLLLDPLATVEEALRPPSGEIRFAGRQFSLVSWAKRFSFEGAQLRSRVQELSGGEQSRLLLAQVMSQPADILLFDEPTNDLDIFARDSLDEALRSFPGAVVLVTHDRYLIEQVATQILGVTEPGKAELYSDFAQWERDIKGAVVPREKKTEKGKKERVVNGLSYKERRELQGIEGVIGGLEKRSKEIEEQLSQGGGAEHLHTLSIELHELQSQIEKTFERWSELEGRGT
jgi:ABC transport system ATP-binding/permease protein